MAREIKPHWAHFLFNKDKGVEHSIVCSQCGWVAVETSDLDNDIKLLIPEQRADGVKKITYKKKGLAVLLSPTCPHCSIRMGLLPKSVNIIY